MPPAVSRVVQAVQSSMAQSLLSFVGVPLLLAAVSYGASQLARHDEQIGELDKRAALVEAGRVASRLEIERRLADNDRRIAGIEENGRRDAAERAKLREDVAVLIAINASLVKGVERIEGKLERWPLPGPPTGGR